MLFYESLLKLELLYFYEFDFNWLEPVEIKNEDTNRFVPAFKKHPEFHYANKNIYSDIKPEEKPAIKEEPDQISI